MGKTNIEWVAGDDGSTGENWQVTRGCRRISPGCGGANNVGGCYAELIAGRFSGPGMTFEGFATRGPHGGRWTGKVEPIVANLAEPLHWRKPRRVFVNSMSDLFHEDVPFEWIACVFAIMGLTPHCTYMVLTKRTDVARRFFKWMRDYRSPDGVTGPLRAMWDSLCGSAPVGADLPEAWDNEVGPPCPDVWPLPNVHLGASVEDVKRAQERLPDLLDCEAAVFWVSYEPALDLVKFDQVPVGGTPGVTMGGTILDALRGELYWRDGKLCRRLNRLGWIVVGGESGRGARPFDLEWARDVIDQGRAAGVPVFVKQAGANPVESGELVKLKAGRKGGTLDALPPELRVREWPSKLPEAR